MNPADLTQTLEALTAFAKVIDALGIPGIVALVVSGPLLMLCSLYLVEFRRNQGMTTMVDDIRTETRTLLDSYRADTQNVLRQLGENQKKTDQYYRDNVELVKGYGMISRNQQDVIIGNTRAIERLITMIEERRKHP